LADNVANLAADIEMLSHAVGVIAEGQHQDRIAGYYGARQNFLQALSLSCDALRRPALVRAAEEATTAAATLQLSMMRDLRGLPSVVTKAAQDKTNRHIAESFEAINDATQLAVQAYAAVDERKAVIASVRGYQVFVEESLLTTVPEGKYQGATLADMLYSSMPPNSPDWRDIPQRIIDSCEQLVATEMGMVTAITNSVEDEDVEA
jgi:hypothetical protein